MEQSGVMYPSLVSSPMRLEPKPEDKPTQFRKSSGFLIETNLFFVAKKKLPSITLPPSSAAVSPALHNGNNGSTSLEETIGKGTLGFSDNNGF